MSPAAAPVAPAARAARPDVIIVGAGPAGCLLALLLAKQSRTVHLFDYRPDPRFHRSDSRKRNRSINLALSTRGLTALAAADLAASVAAIGTPMHGRCVHAPSPEESLQFQRYGLPGQFLLSVSRSRLNEVLLDACSEATGVEVEFEARCVGMKLEVPQVTIARDGKEVCVEGGVVIGADGAFSAVRAAMARKERFDYSQSYVSAAYKELGMVNVGKEGREAFPSEWLHIWPRHRFMLIALPNDQGSFTATLFMDKERIEELSSEERVRSFFEKNFPDAVEVMPSLVEDFLQNPTPSLLTIRCEPYNFGGKAVLIGDAAHAIVPFYGQGCNAAFEDCRLLAESFEKHGWDKTELALDSYAKTRKANAEAIADLAIDHYEDMSSRSANSLSVLRRRLEILANRLFPSSFLPLYTMISFSNIPYDEAVRRASKQERDIERALLLLGIALLCIIAFATTRGLRMLS